MGGDKKLCHTVHILIELHTRKHSATANTMGHSHVMVVVHGGCSCLRNKACVKVQSSWAALRTCPHSALAAAVEQVCRASLAWTEHNNNAIACRDTPACID